jgi:hypothetical protein
VGGTGKEDVDLGNEACPCFGGKAGFDEVCGGCVVRGVRLLEVEVGAFVAGLLFGEGLFHSDNLSLISDYDRWMHYICYIGL